MIFNKKIFGHDKQYKILVDAYNHNFPQSWLLIGEKGIGKFSLLEKFITWSIANDFFDYDIDKDKTFDSKEISILKKKLSISLYQINNNNSSGIEEIRQLIDSLSLTNTSEKINKYIIIDNFDNLNLNCFNALLKTIEEPPKKTIIFLICHNLKKIPITISSRCMNLNFNNLSNLDFEKYMNTENLEISNLQNKDIYSYFSGRPGFMQKVLNSNGLKIIELIEDIISQETLSHLKLKIFIDEFMKNSCIFFDLTKNFFYLQTINLIKNTKDKNIIKNSLFFFEYLNNYDFDSKLNINNNQIIINLFINYFKLIK